MRLLLDECMPRRFGRALAEHEVESVQSMRWRGVSNGALINRISNARFDVFITVDKGIPFQQNLRDLPFAIIVLRAHTNDAGVVMQFVPRVREILKTIVKGAVIVVEE
jgi:predicted nuclease of predicted toxin-antitoxin system